MTVFFTADFLNCVYFISNKVKQAHTDNWIYSVKSLNVTLFNIKTKMFKTLWFLCRIKQIFRFLHSETLTDEDFSFGKIKQNFEGSL